MEIHLVSSLTADDESRLAPKMLAAIGKVLNGLPVSYTFTNGVPRSLTQFASPIYTIDQLNPDLALYVQDQWRISRLTISAGVRSVSRWAVRSCAGFPGGWNG